MSLHYECMTEDEHTCEDNNGPTNGTGPSHSSFYILLCCSVPVLSDHLPELSLLSIVPAYYLVQLHHLVALVEYRGLFFFPVVSLHAILLDMFFLLLYLHWQEGGHHLYIQLFHNFLIITISYHPSFS
eukprot:TRINITY_DN16245_c0_g1_i2.p1 TRINITY_DN16245_c0_g1~~TRINITY_DN16245_c0_g1_i2.p1  ORF type:complete len:128 (+),score=10.81 TRINITY_DN16245_c0_g1_i2:127-510(+)